MFLTLKSDQPANSFTGIDITDQQTDPTPEPPQTIQMTPAPYPQVLQSTNLNLDSAPPREQSIRRPPKQYDPHTGTWT